MNLLQDVLTYMRRILKNSLNSQITDNLMIDYVNRFWIMDIAARIQLFDQKTTYRFMTQPGFDTYNMPLYSVQTEPGAQTVASYPVYQGFLPPAYINGIQVPIQTEQNSFYNIWPDITQQGQVLGTGNGTNGPYTLTFSVSPTNSLPINPPMEYILRGNVDMAGIVATGSNADPVFGTTLNPLIPTTSITSRVYFTSQDANQNNVIVQDSGQFLFAAGGNNPQYGLLMSPGPAPFGNTPLPNGGGLPTPYATNQNTINYFTGTATNVYFPAVIPDGVDITGTCFFMQTGLPRAMLYFNNQIVLRSPPDQQYLVELTAYLTPAAFLSTSQAVPFAYMSEYIARGAVRKILADNESWDQFDRYEPLFLEQQTLVWKRSQRQITASRTQTIYSQGINIGQSGFNNFGGSTF